MGWDASRYYESLHFMNHYVQRPDAFGPKWMIGFNVTPVVKNVIAEWLK
jgi:hypothetical protein